MNQRDTSASSTSTSTNDVASIDIDNIEAPSSSTPQQQAPAPASDHDTQGHLHMPTPQRQLTNRIASLLDPSSLDSRSFLLDSQTWDEPHLQRLVSAIQPSDLMVINRKRQAARLEEPAKTLEWKNLTLVDRKGVRVLDDVSGILNPGELVGVLGGPGQYI
jgi:hypothetical protein